MLLTTISILGNTSKHQFSSILMIYSGKHINQTFFLDVKDLLGNKYVVTRVKGDIQF